MTPEIDGARLLRRLTTLGQIGALEGGGVCRLALTDADKAGRDWLVAEMERLGLNEHLSAQRSNGLRPMIERIRETAAAHR